MVLAIARAFQVPKRPYASVQSQKRILSRMAAPANPPKNISELIDDVERIREELLTIPRSMEKLETRKVPASSAKGKKSA
jgi:hypothetical protein